MLIIKPKYSNFLITPSVLYCTLTGACSFRIVKVIMLT